MQKISEALRSRKFEAKPHALKHEWQAFAYKIWKDYSGDKKELPRVIKLVKMYNEGYRSLLDGAYNFCKDYQGPVPKIKLFYWKFWQLKKSNEGKREADIRPTGPDKGVRQIGSPGEKSGASAESPEKPESKTANI